MLFRSLVVVVEAACDAGATEGVAARQRHGLEEQLEAQRALELVFQWRDAPLLEACARGSRTAAASGVSSFVRSFDERQEWDTLACSPARLLAIDECGIGGTCLA